MGLSSGTLPGPGAHSFSPALTTCHASTCRSLSSPGLCSQGGHFTVRLWAQTPPPSHLWAVSYDPETLFATAGLNIQAGLGCPHQIGGFMKGFLALGSSMGSIASSFPLFTSQVVS